MQLHKIYLTGLGSEPARWAVNIASRYENLATTVSVAPVSLKVPLGPHHH